MYDEGEELEDWQASEPATPSRHHLSDNDDDDFLAQDGPSQGFSTYTSFDAYFQHTSKPSRTSNNVFSALVPPLTPEEYADVVKRLQTDTREQDLVLWRDPATRKTSFRRYRTELEEGFNLMMYGYGSKREFLNAFAQHLARKGEHVVVANGFQPSFAFRDLLDSIDRVPGVLDAPSSSGGSASGQDAHVQRILAFFSSQDAPRLFLVVHNIEGNAFRNAKNRAALALLALALRIHLVASVDHIAASQRWSLSELFARKSEPLDPASPALADVVPQRGFAWLWHDLTTLAPYDFELAYADPTSLTGVAALRGARAPTASSAVVGPPGGTQAAIVTETAARHVLASVTQKAKKLFVILGSKQLEVMDAHGADGKDKADGDSGGDKGPTPGEGAYDYDRLFATARDNFVATNDTALRALLGEFRDHGLVVSTTTQGGEAMWIPMRRDALLKVVGDLKAEGA
ncbi:origin recognition complex subunit 2 [Epithele typhae]|uniref:origin recognition complex subunit 2 n=1 Tax=Epithele typhae TaxID=378194 RepID=UPI002008307D|nr:origin recognition complex subunit 2 [Epithele typhae]KAH9945832.1 origin recognition complex subunit 2 [Epithele typhae]